MDGLRLALLAGDHKGRPYSGGGTCVSYH
jgi:hypothetical protein